MATPLHFILVVNDGGEMKTIDRRDFDAIYHEPMMLADLDAAINTILDKRAGDAGEYDPADNDTPMEFVFDEEAAYNATPEINGRLER